MRTQSSKHHTNTAAVQPQTMFPKEDRMKKQNSTTLKLAVLVAMVITMVLSAGAQTQTVYMVTQDNVCGTNPTCDTNTLVSFTLPANGGLFTATPIGQTGAEIRGLAFDNYNNKLYGITAQGVLVTVSTTNGATLPVLTLTLLHRMNGAAWLSMDRTLCMR